MVTIVPYGTDTPSTGFPVAPHAATVRRGGAVGARHTGSSICRDTLALREARSARAATHELPGLFQRQRWAVPTGKVRFYDADKGFGFIAGDEGEDVFLHASALPEGVTTLKKGTRVDFGIVEGRRGAQALSVRVLEPSPSVTAGKREQTRKKPEEMVVLIEDTIKLLDDASNSLRRGRRPDKAHGDKLATVLRFLADQLES
jgi:CspA family cold shock protein